MSPSNFFHTGCIALRQAATSSVITSYSIHYTKLYEYHKPHWAHPLKPVTSLVFDTLEPFAKGMWRNEVREFASGSDRYTWHKQTFFGSLFQKVVAQRR